jgi:hypothetical protein
LPDDHTESVAHLTREAGDAWRVVPRGLLPAVVVSVCRSRRARQRKHDPQAVGHGYLITARRLRAAWPMGRMSIRWRRSSARCRTTPASAAATTPTSCRRISRAKPSNGWSRKRIEHLVLDVPSVDRTHDDGHWSATACSSACRRQHRTRRCGALARHHHRARVHPDEVPTALRAVAGGARHRR